MKLTEREFGTPDKDSLIHIVNPEDKTQSPDGSSYKTPLGDLNGIFGDKFLNKYVIYVDPNGNDTSAEFGNKDKPFKTLRGALFAAADFMSNNPNIWVPYDTDLYTNIDLDRISLTSIFYEIPQIEIEVYPGLYNAADEVVGMELYINLMYSNIVWNFHKGAIMLNYSWDDSYNMVDQDVETDRPYKCTVTGEGTFFNYTGPFIEGGTGYVYLENSGTLFNFKADISNYILSIYGGKMNYTVRKHMEIRTQSGEGFGGNTIDMALGVLNFKCDLLQWILPNRFSYFNNSFSLIYQEGGKLNIDINKYFAVFMEDKVSFLEIPPPLIDYLNLISSDVPSGSPDQSWSFRVFNEEINYPNENYVNAGDGYAPNIGYIWERDAMNNPTVTNISINYAKIYSYGIQVEGGDVTFTTKLTELTPTYYPGKPGGYYTQFAYLGGPYDSDSKSKFSILGGKIKCVTDNVIDYYEDVYANLLNIYDSGVQVYVNNVRFLMSRYYNRGDVFSLDIASPNIYQDFALILDSVKCMTEYPLPASGYFANFWVDNGGDPAPIKIYGNCFSNFPDETNPFGDTVDFLIPGTSLIIDSNVQII